MNPNAEFERDLERWLQAEAPASAPAGLHAAVIDRARTMRQRPGWATSLRSRWFGRGRGRGITLFAAAALVIVGGAVAAAGSGLLRMPSVVPPEPVPSSAAVPTPSAAEASPSPTISPSPTTTAPSWTLTGSMTTPRQSATATLLPDGRVLMAGGTDGGGNLSGTRILASAELYDPDTGSWTATGGMTFSRLGATATPLPDGRVLVAGGSSGAGNQTGDTQILASAELYDPGTGTWAPTGSMGTKRQGATATRLPDGKVLVAGGSSANAGSDVSLASAELYDPSTGTWTATGNMGTRRRGHTATLLPDGKVLVAGGDDCCGGAAPSILASAELYDPGTGTWTATGTMSKGRASQTATLLPDGRVLVAGGGAPFPTNYPELYDPGTGTWTATGSMSGSRMGHTATLLPDGQVLVAGGANNDVSVPVPSAELYDPDTGSWTATGSMTAPRFFSTATRLPDGRVLVAGGLTSTELGPVAGKALASAELYDPGSGVR